MAYVHERLEFAPPAAPGMAGALLLALLTHALLLLALGMGVQWKSKVEPVVVQAELWANLPQIAEPTPVLQPEPEPKTKPEPEPAPEPPAKLKSVSKIEPAPPTPAPTLPDPQIVQEKLRLQKEKLQQEQRTAEKQAQDKAENDKLEKAKLEKAKLEKAKLDKEKIAQQERDKQEKLRQELAQKDTRKRATDAPKPDAPSDEEIAKAEAQKREELRQQSLKRMAGMAGGAAAQNAGPSAEYAGRIRARITPNITYTDTISGNPTTEIEVRTMPDGTIISRKISKSSGVKSWDDAVLAAIDKTEVLPRDQDGRVPGTLMISFRPRD